MSDIVDRVRDDLERRAALHAALGEPVRLGIVEELSRSTGHRPTWRPVLASQQPAGPSPRRARGGRSRASASSRPVTAAGATCSSARAPPGAAESRPTVPGQGALRLHPQLGPVPAGGGAVAARTGTSIVGRHPPRRAVHPAQSAAAERAGLDLGGAAAHPPERRSPADLVVTVCDRAHEELHPPGSWRTGRSPIRPRSAPQPHSTTPSRPRHPHPHPHRRDQTMSDTPPIPSPPNRAADQARRHVGSPRVRGHVQRRDHRALHHRLRRRSSEPMHASPLAAAAHRALHP